MEKEVKIYVLKNPETNEIHYVGRSVNPKGRYRMHIHLAIKTKHKNKKDAWICSLLNKNLKPIMEIIDITSQKESIEKEKFWIEELRKTCDLKNSRDYIENNYLFSEETRKKMSDAAMGNTSKRGTICSDETKGLISASMMGMKHSDESKKNVSKIVLQYDRNGDFIKEWPSGKEAAKCLKISQGSLSSAALGYRKTCGKFIWKYKN
jgi:group I intron endonuclease